MAAPPTTNNITVAFIMRELEQSPRSQFNIYSSPDMLPAWQRELVQYRSVGQGRVRRSTMSQSRGVVLPAAEFRRYLMADLAQLRQYFYTFMSMPRIGLTAPHDGTPYSKGYRVAYPRPISQLPLQ